MTHGLSGGKGPTGVNCNDRAGEPGDLVSDVRQRLESQLLGDGIGGD